MDLHLVILPSGFIRHPALGAAQFKIPVRQLSACLLHAGSHLVAHIVRAVHEKVTASACSQKFASQGACLQSLFIQLVNLRICYLAAHALLALPAIVQKLAKAVEISL